MARAVWSGTLSFGLVSIPVKAYTAVRDHRVHFHQLDPEGNRIGYEKVSKETGEPVDKDDIQLGYEVGKGTYVTVDPDELDELRPDSTRRLEISDFVDLADIDPVYYDRTYWLAPDGDTAPYQLLATAMTDQGKVGIGTVVMRNKQYLAAIRPLEKVLAMSTMRFADEVVDRSDLDELPKRSRKPDPKHLELANQIVSSLATDWDPSRYHDTYTEELRDLLDRRAAGEEIVVEKAERDDAKVTDLMAALEASVAGARSGKGGKSGGKAANRRTKSKGSSRKSA